MNQIPRRDWLPGDFIPYNKSFIHFVSVHNHTKKELANIQQS